MKRARDLIAPMDRYTAAGASRSRLETLRRIAGVLGLLTAAGVFLWQLPHFLAGNSTIWPQYANAFTDMLAYTAWGAAVLLVLTAFTRTVPLRLLLTFWFLGVFAVHGLVVAVERSFIDVLGVSEMGIWVAPVVETLAVLLVVVAFYALATYRSGTHPTVSDGLLVGFATGAGLGFHEEMTYARLVPIGPGAEYASVGRMGQDIWWSYVFPLIGWQGQFNIRQFGNGVTGHFTLYHAGWATLVGVGVGAVFVHRHRILAWIAGLTAVVVTYLDHMSGNFIVGRPLETPPVVGDLFQAGDATGVSELAVYILLFAIIVAIAVDLSVFRRTAGRISEFPPAHSALLGGRTAVTKESLSQAGVVGVVGRLRAIDNYTRQRRAVLTGLQQEANLDRDSAALVPALAALRETGKRGMIMSGAGIGLLGVLAVVGASNPGVSLVQASSALTRTLSCAGCAPPSRFLDLAPSLLGGIGSVVAVVSAVRDGVSDTAAGLPADARTPDVSTVWGPDRVDDPCSIEFE